MNDAQTIPLLSTSHNRGSTAETSLGMSTAVSSSPIAAQRICSLDLFRGLVIFQSLIQPMVGYFDRMPEGTRHVNYFFSWADSTMPLFYVAVGFAMQLTLGRLRAREGDAAMIRKQARRSTNLFFIGLILYGFSGYATYEELRANWFKVVFQPLGWWGGIYETLTIIAVAQLAILPVITRGILPRVAAILVYLSIYTGLLRWFWFNRVWEYVDGGLFAAIFSHSALMLLGSFLHDFCDVTHRRRQLALATGSPAAGRRAVAGCVAALAAIALGLIFVGVALTALPPSWSGTCYTYSNRSAAPCSFGASIGWPFIRPSTDLMSMWTMSHRSTPAALQFFMAGFSYLIFLCCFLLVDVGTFAIPGVLQMLSVHSLLNYIVRDVGFRFAQNIIPADAPLGFMPLAVAVALLVNLNILYYCQRHKINVTL